MFVMRFAAFLVLASAVASSSGSVPEAQSVLQPLNVTSSERLGLKWLGTDSSLPKIL